MSIPRPGRFILAAVLTALLVGGAFTRASASEYTSVMSAADRDDKWDGVLGIRYDWLMRQSSITREYICDPTDPGCPATAGIARRAELDSVRDTHFMNIDMRIGLYRDFEFFATFPFAVMDRTELDFASGVRRGNSTVYPSSGAHLFEVDNRSATRHGFGDILSD